MPCLSRSDIEKIAQRVITAYRKLPAQEGQAITSIDPKLLAKDLLGLMVQYHRFSPTGYVHGLTVFGKAMATIYDNLDHTGSYLLDGKTILPRTKSCTVRQRAFPHYHQNFVHIPTRICGQLLTGGSQ